MTQDIDQQDQEQNTTALRPGDILRSAREAKKLSTQEVADHLRLRKQLVEEIEDNRFDPKVAGTFTRGYLRAYAKLVEIPEEEVIAAYYELGIEAPRKDSMQSFSRRTKQQTADSRLMLITYVIAAVIVASVVLFAWQQINQEEMPTTSSMMQQDSAQMDVEDAIASASEEEPVVTTPDEVIDDMTESATSADSTQTNILPVETQTAGDASSTEAQTSEPAEQQESNQSQTAGTDNQVAESQTNETAAVEEPQASAPDPSAQAMLTIDDVDPNSGDLVFFFENDCWVRIDDATGENVAGGVKRAGYIMALNGEAPFRIELGAPEVVEMWYQGERVDMAQFRQGRVARFTWPVQTIEQ
ncbi:MULTISPECIES: cytoskeleton protein RodZ [Gammaproteobacteria]|uniref:cytoskeleton protein RodZ n=1 Tax=Gammaproteobacteria TaxID=1236 RepID=UPI000DCFF441|nr:MULTISPECIES: cytoskeleton protein RodZ [Gammaproteobacteria]RTE86213.1 cytoskeleton protein RodZ [Aliidiomarina sp. B3213]TCZ91565.1 cytoskeleton protein RodZ [Lysobacter sp. N42]